ncbi:MAG: EMC3/TMCO1 family protein [Candidatus Thorarchaeota archaeon]
MQDPFGDFMAWFNIVFAIFKTPPLSALFIMGISMSITTLSNLAMRRFSDMRRLNRYQAEIKQHQEMQKEAERTQNEKLARKVKRRKAYIERIQREMMTQRCKPSLIFFIPFIILFAVLRAFYFIIDDPITGAGHDQVVAIIPFSVHKLLPFLVGWLGVATPYGFGMTFFGFYMLVGLGLGQILQRVMGVSIT